MKGKFIVIEGLDGAGKTNATLQVKKILSDHGITNVVCTREPGGTPLAEKLRLLIKYNISNERITNRAELLMIYAARVQLVECVIRPALNKGSWVVGDRHDLSSQAYQGGGRGMNKKFLTTLRNIILGDFYPDLTLYLDVLPCIGLNRIKHRKYKTDRIERESLMFFHRTRMTYRMLAKMDRRIITIDANQSQTIVNNIIKKHLTKWLSVHK